MVVRHVQPSWFALILLGTVSVTVSVACHGMARRGDAMRCATWYRRAFIQAAASLLINGQIIHE